MEPGRIFQPRRIGVITTSRADYGIYRPLLRAWRAADGEVELFAGGTHSLARFGRTVDEIVGDDWGPVHAIDHGGQGDRDLDIARSCGQAVQAFAVELDKHRPDLLFVLGDRYEMLAAGLAAAIMKLPIAHLHGGDATEGVIDESFRHALTKLSHVHFPAVEQHAARIRNLGEEAWRIHAVGALALDELARFEPEALETIAREIGLPLGATTVVLSYHPETLGPAPAGEAFDAVAAGLAEYEGNLLIVGVNADAGHLDIAARMAALAARRPRTVLAASLTQQRYWSWLHHAAALVGNSSSGLIEAPSLKLPVVNVGDRQRGRMRAANVIDVPADAAAVKTALARAMSTEFRQGLAGLANPYGDGRAAARILGVLASLPARDVLIRKRAVAAE